MARLTLLHHRLLRHYIAQLLEQYLFGAIHAACRTSANHELGVAVRVDSNETQSVDLPEKETDGWRRAPLPDSAKLIGGQGRVAGVEGRHGCITIQ